jgi:hypothetical protein
MMRRTIADDPPAVPGRAKPGGVKLALVSAPHNSIRLAIMSDGGTIARERRSSGE